MGRWQGFQEAWGTQKSVLDALATHFTASALAPSRVCFITICEPQECDRWGSVGRTASCTLRSRQDCSSCRQRTTLKACVGVAVDNHR